MAYLQFTPTLMQYKEVISEPLYDGQTMPKNGEIPTALYDTPLGI